ncbi:MAG: hypothetical protein ACJA2G_003224 [Cognaticolwellia sp.]|jgi:hypothetical protein
MDELLEESEGLHSEFSRIFEYGPADDSKRITSSWIMCLIAQEHASSLRQLVMCGNYTSAICIKRSQFESFTRAVWLFYAATEEKVIKRTAMLTSSQKGCSSFNYDGCYVDFLQLN